METALQTFSPREIQARVRAGDSAEIIAAENDWPLDKVLRYAEPLLAERAFVAQQATAVEVRRSGGGATLLESAALALGASPDDTDIAWDAYRREDGKWIVTATYLDVDGTHRAEWTYDHSGRNLHPIDDDARTLMGARPMPVPDVDADIADALDLAADIPVVREAVVDARPYLVAVPDADDADERADAAVDAGLVIEEIVVDEVIVEEYAFDDGIDAQLDFDQGSQVPPGEDTIAVPRPEPAPRPAARKPRPARKGRASVPSWDEILFGATKTDD